MHKSVLCLLTIAILFLSLPALSDEDDFDDETPQAPFTRNVTKALIVKELKGRYLDMSPDFRKALEVVIEPEESGYSQQLRAYNIGSNGKSEHTSELYSGIYARWSDDSSQYIYLGLSEKDKSEVVVGGEPAGEYEGTASGFIIGPKGKHWLLCVKDGQLTCVIYDGEVRGKYKNVYLYSIGPSGKLIYMAQGTDNKYVIVTDGKESEHYDEMVDGLVARSPEGSQVAYVARLGKTTKLFVKGGSRDFEYEIKAGIACPVFSPDGRRFAAAVRLKDGDKAALVLDGEVIKGDWGKFYPLTVIFSPDSKKEAFLLARLSSGRIISTRFELNGKTEKEYHRLSDFAFSPDGQHYAYYGLNDPSGYSVVLDGAEIDGERISLEKEVIEFSPDGSRIFYYSFGTNAQNNTIESALVVRDVGGEETSRSMFYRVYSPVWSPDSKYAAFIGIELNYNTDEQKHWIVVNGFAREIDGKLLVYDHPRPSLYWCNEKTVRYAVIKEGDFYIVEEEIVEK